MSDTGLRPILDRQFRACPTYRAVTLDRLPQTLQESLCDLQDVPDLYGVLEPLAGTGTYKAVSRDVALLFFTLQAPGRLPSFTEQILGIGANQEIARLVLDGVLEIEHEESFVSGAAAHPVLFGCRRREIPDLGRLQRLSLAAMRYAQRLDIEEIPVLSARMYFYNRIPVTPFWRRLLARREGVLEFLRLEDGGPLRTRLNERWSSSTPRKKADNGWIRWNCKSPRSKSSAQAGTYKLYLSPRPHHLAEVMVPAIELFAAHGATSFKFGADAYNLLRPDKLVAYFQSFNDLSECAREMAGEVGNLPAHGVPFSVELNPGGLFSWGVDPPPDEQWIGWQERESWRLWLSNRLANAIILARSQPQRTIEPYVFALDRLECEGVDTSSWAPRGSMWDATANQDRPGAET